MSIVKFWVFEPCNISCFWCFVTFWIFEFYHILSFWVLSNFQFLSFVTFWLLTFVTFWVSMFCKFWFCLFLSFFMFSSFVTFRVFDFVSFWVFEFCHNLSFWGLSYIVFLSFVTFWFFLLHFEFHSIFSSNFEFLTFVIIWVFEFCHILSFLVKHLVVKKKFVKKSSLGGRGHRVAGHCPYVIFFHAPNLFVCLQEALKYILFSFLTPCVTCFPSYLSLKIWFKSILRFCIPETKFRIIPKNLTYGKNWISRPMQIVEPIPFCFVFAVQIFF